MAPNSFPKGLKYHHGSHVEHKVATWYPSDSRPRYVPCSCLKPQSLQDLILLHMPAECGIYMRGVFGGEDAVIWESYSGTSLYLACLPEQRPSILHSPQRICSTGAQEGSKVACNFTERLQRIEAL